MHHSLVKNNTIRTILLTAYVTMTPLKTDSRNIQWGVKGVPVLH